MELDSGIEPIRESAADIARACVRPGLARAGDEDRKTCWRRRGGRRRHRRRSNPRGRNGHRETVAIVAGVLLAVALVAWFVR